MILKGARVARNATEALPLDLSIEAGRVRPGAHSGCGPVLDLSGFLVLPGLINAHDHLEFNLFPRLGSGPYANATAWAEDIYRPHESPVREHLRIPKELRLLWGGIKNLLSGVTTVAHHNPYEPAVFERDFPVRVIRRMAWAHSLRFDGDVATAYAGRPSGAPFLIHAGEGTDAGARDEIHCLDAAGVLGPTTIVVHGVALDADGVALMRQRGASLVWCPSSNLFVLGRSLSTEVLQSDLPIALGTDSALTGAGDLIDEIEWARRQAGIERVYRMVTDIPARMLRLECGEGSIRAGGMADLVVTPDHGQTPAEALLGMNPAMVLVGGRVKLVTAAMAAQVAPLVDGQLQPIEMQGRGRWQVACDVAALTRSAAEVLGDDFRLAGKGVAA